MLKGYTKAEKSWMLYDWANSAFATIIAAIILPIFFKEIAHQNGVSDVDATAFWGYATSCGTLICAVLAPFMGTLGDFKGMKKRLFTFFMLLGVISSALLAFTGNWKALLALYVLGTLGFNGSCVYYDSFLLDVTTEERMDRVSTLGYGLGYIGGSTIPLVLSLLLIQLGDAIGIGTMLATRISFLLTAGWWLVFTLPMLRHVHQKHGIDPERNIVLHTLRNVKDTCCMILKNKSVVFFIIAYFFYIDGVGTIIHMSTSYGAQLGLGDTEMMLALLLVQILGLPFCLMYIKLAGKFGARVMVGVGICIYMGICVFGFFVRETWQFWVLAILVATSQGGIQALSRSMFGKMLPDKNRSGEYFGFFDIFGKFSSVMGPALMGFVTQIATVVLLGRQSLTPETAPEAVLAAAQQEASPWGVLSVLLIFLVGAVLYFGVLPRMLKKEGAGK